MEVAFERYIERHNLYTLCKVESPEWTIFHTNVHEKVLEQVREDYLARKGIEPYINIGASGEDPDPSHVKTSLTLLRSGRAKTIGS